MLALFWKTVIRATGALGFSLYLKKFCWGLRCRVGSESKYPEVPHSTPGEKQSWQALSRCSAQNLLFIQGKSPDLKHWSLYLPLFSEFWITAICYKSDFARTFKYYESENHKYRLNNLVQQLDGSSVSFNMRLSRSIKISGYSVNQTGFARCRKTETWGVLKNGWKGYKNKWEGVNRRNKWRWLEENW